jgi:hypothetical protein
MADTSRSTVWVDVNGRTRQTILRGNATLAGVQAALAAISYAVPQRVWEGPTSFPAGTAVPGTYQNVADYAQLVYQDAGGDLVYITLPACAAAIFLADGETVDPANAAIAALNAAVIGTVLTAAGGVVTAYVGGFRRRSGREYQ